MAALEEEFTLSSVVLSTGPDGLLGVEQSDKTDQFLVTDSSRTVVLYKVSDQKPLGSWSVKQGQVITSPAVCNFQTGEYIVVHDNKLSAEVYRILSIQGTEPVVLFKEGAVRSLEALLAEPQQKIETVISDEEVIKWTKFFMVFRHPLLIFITEKHGNYFAYVQMFNSRILSKYTLLLGQEEKSIVQSFTASADRKFISLMSLSSDGCVYESLIPVHPSDAEENQRVVRSVLLKTVVSGSARNGVALTVLDQDHVAVLGPSMSTSKECLSIWNIKFQTLQSSKELPQGTSGQKDSEKHIEVELRKFLAAKRTPDFHTQIGDIVTELLGRRKAEPSFYPRNCLMQLIQTHVLSYSLCPDLMEVAIEKTDVQLLQLCLHQFPDIPESITCTCLKIFLSIDDDSLHETDINMESVFDHSHTAQVEKREGQTEILQNGFTAEGNNHSNCEQELHEKPQDTAEESSCPVIPKRAALLYPLEQCPCFSSAAITGKAVTREYLDN
ncbi:Nucleolar protein 11 [Tupaia chinensis]|uniref:Nucleolar protein 11 n=1 Tax=Tupaia chinensis TaxID=246437 RepID=L9KX38_TUPCH|nr:Nucleolar protein 11 [Tupaia chinensis]